MKKTLCILLTLVLCLGMLSACSSSTTSAPAQEGSAAAAPAASDGKTYNLVVVNHDASTSMCEEYVETLCNMMSEESGGRLQFSFNPGGSLLGATETMDGVKDGTADICWSCTSFFGSRFPVSEFINLCANGITSARMATDVYQQMYQEIPELQSELSDWKILALHSCAYGPVSTVDKKIETAEDFKGMQIRTAGTIAAQYISALGANPMTVPTSEVYESIEKKVIDGFTNDCLDLPISYTSCFVMMNKNTFDSLPDDLKAIIDKYADNYAGDMAGYWWDSCNYWVADKMRANNVEVYKPSDELYAWATSDELVRPIHEWYINYLNDAGLNGQAIYDKCMEIVQANKEAHAHDWDAPFSYKDWNYTPDTLK